VQEAALDDAVQDVFLVVHRRLGDFEGRSSIKSWLFGIARRVAKDHRRRRDRKDRGKVPTDGLVSSQTSPREQAANAEARRVLHDFLTGLDDDKREVFVLAELEQMSAPEIAEATGANVNTVYSRLRVARQRFEETAAKFAAGEREA
jgi:RNA polymerase sigma-70 factor (ECF subfamily)